MTRVWLPELLPKDVKRAEHTYVVVFWCLRLVHC